MYLNVRGKKVHDKNVQQKCPLTKMSIVKLSDKKMFKHENAHGEITQEKITRYTTD